MSGTYRSKYEALASALPKRDQRLMACRIARWVLTEHRVEDPRLWEAVEVSERYADGLATRAELFSAQAAAWDAARAAARGAAEDAAGASWAVAYATRAAALAAAEDAAWAARAAARYAADAAWAAADAAADDRADAVAARTAAYKMFFEWALELAIGELDEIRDGQALLPSG